LSAVAKEFEILIVYDTVGVGFGQEAQIHKGGGALEDILVVAAAHYEGHLLLDRAV